jgi:hypothetical protein
VAAGARWLFIYDGQLLVGTIKVAGDGVARAFDPAGRCLGEFSSVKAASAAISTPNAKHRQQNRRALAANRRRERDERGAARG